MNLILYVLLIFISFSSKKAIYLSQIACFSLKKRKITFIFVKYLFQLLVFYSTWSPLQISHKKAKKKKEKEKKKISDCQLYTSQRTIHKPMLIIDKNLKPTL